MKYTSSNPPKVCMMTNSTCYKGTRTMTICGVLWHSTGANNPNLKRYVQPSSNDSNFDSLMSLLGRNTNGNDWNHIVHQAGLNAWIGKTASGEVTTIQTMPWNYRPWGCGSGSKGSCNTGWIQFEICEDNLSDKAYFDKVYKEACELTAYLCKKYGINPKASVKVSGQNVPTILCHADSYRLGMGSNHGDIYHWFKKYGKDMNTVREDVAKLMATNTITPNPQPKPPTSTDFKVGQEIALISGAKYTSGKTIPDWVIKSKLYVRSVRPNKDIVFSTQKTGAVTGVVNPSQIKSASYLVKVTADVLNVRSGPGTNYKINTQIKRNEVYTIVDAKNGWGKLKSGAGWISLNYTKRV